MYGMIGCLHDLTVIEYYLFVSRARGANQAYLSDPVSFSFPLYLKTIQGRSRGRSSRSTRAFIMIIFIYLDESDKVTDVIVLYDGRVDINVIVVTEDE